MATNNYLSKIDSLLADMYRERRGILEESQIKMSLNINDYGKPYLLYSFDKNVRLVRGGKTIELQPYFKSSEGVKSMCDYFLFSWMQGKLYVLLIELKQGKEQVTRQLDAGKLFASYLISTLNRVNKINLKPVIRKIAIRDYHIAKKGTTIKSVEYGTDSFCTFYGSCFHLLEFLK